MIETIEKLQYKAKANVSGAKKTLEERIKGKVVLPLLGINGEKICITAKSELEEQIKTIKKLYKALSNDKLEKDCILLDSFNSATIEGAHTTVSEVRKSFLNPKTKDAKMVVNTVNAQNYAYQNPINQDNIRQLWDTIVDGVCENKDKAGTLYRNGMVFIGNDTNTVHTPAPANKIKKMMENAFDFYSESEMDNILKSFVFHFYFVYIHPFCDGNGRCARVINSSQLYFSGMNKIRYIPLITAINRNLPGYYRSLIDSEITYETDKTKWLDISPFLSYMLDVYEQGIIDASKAKNRLSQSETIILERMNKKGQGAEITVKNAAKILNQTEGNARKVLNKLAEKQYLSINMDNRPYIYKLLENKGRNYETLYK